MIVFFDGECGLCDRVVRWLMRLDREEQLQFAPLQGSTARERLAAGLVSELGTMVVWNDGQVWTQSEALRQIAHVLRRPWWLRLLLAISPRVLRDLGYRLIASQRHRLGRGYGQCEPLTARDRMRMLP